jgi:hypothetical protein
MKPLLYSLMLFAYIVSTAVASDKLQFKPRTWTSKSGATIEAALVKSDKYTAVLQKIDGSTVKISPTALSRADQDYLAKAAVISKYGGWKPFLEVASRSEGDRKLRFECHPNGFLVLSTFVYHPNAGGGTATIIPDYLKLIAAFEKGIEWCRIAKETSAHSDSKELYNALDRKVGCLDGMTISFRTQDWLPSSSSSSHVDALRARSRNRSNVIFPLIEVDIYKEAFPYSQSAEIILNEEDLKTIVAELKKVPFELMKELATAKEEESEGVYK